MYSCWARCSVCTRVWPRYAAKSRSLAALGSARTAAHLGRRALHDNGRSRPRAGGSEDPPLGPPSLRSGWDALKRAPTTPSDGGEQPAKRHGALAAIALAGLKTRHYNLPAWKAQKYGWPAFREVRQWRPSAKVKEHNEERSLERLVDMELSRKKD